MDNTIPQEPQGSCTPAVVTTDGGHECLVRVRGDEPMTDLDRTMLTELVNAVHAHVSTIRTYDSRREPES